MRQIRESFMAHCILTVVNCNCWSIQKCPELLHCYYVLLVNRYNNELVVCLRPSVTSNTMPLETNLYRLSSSCVVSRGGTIFYVLIS